MSTHLQAMGHQFVTTRCRDRIRTNKYRRIHRYYTPACTTYPWFVYLYVKCIDLLHHPRRKIKRRLRQRTCISRRSCTSWRSAKAIRTIEREYLICDAPSSVNIRNGLYRFLVSSPALASSRQIKMTFYCDTLMERSQLLCLRRMQELFRAFFSLFLCVFYNNSHLCVMVFSMRCKF